MPSPSPSASVRRDLLTEKFHALLDESELVMDNADFGQTLNDLETFFLIEGRKFLKEVFQEKFQERIEQTETNAPLECPDCKKKTAVHDIKPKTIVSAHGAIKLHRRYCRCFRCKERSYPVEVTLGIPKSYTHGLKRVVARCCGQASYRLTQDNLEELCQIHFSPTTIGNIADETALEMSARLASNPDVRKAFQSAPGETEFQIDGTCINTRNADGKAEYREMKIAVEAKRECGVSATPSEWDTRDLPPPTAVYAVAAIEGKAEFQERCQAMRRLLGTGGITSALGDGAPWLWDITRHVYGKSEECLDIYHGAERISACAKVLFGEGQSSTEWFERMRMVLLSEGLDGLERECAVLLSGELKKSHRTSLVSLLDYFRKHSERLDYAGRLLRGRSIGSGMVEGCCKNLIGKRLKQTKACWRVERANRIAIISAALYADQWKQAWKITH